jgi:hypothetical protein
MTQNERWESFLPQAIEAKQVSMAVQNQTKAVPDGAEGYVKLVPHSIWWFRAAEGKAFFCDYEEGRAYADKLVAAGVHLYGAPPEWAVDRRFLALEAEVKDLRERLHIQEELTRLQRQLSMIK